MGSEGLDTFLGAFSPAQNLVSTRCSLSWALSSGTVVYEGPHMSNDDLEVARNVASDPETVHRLVRRRDFCDFE